MKDAHRQTGSSKAPIAKNINSTSKSTITLVVRIASMAIFIMFPVKDGGAASPSSGMGWEVLECQDPQPRCKFRRLFCQSNTKSMSWSTISSLRFRAGSNIS
jgi:hypothetical protein